MGSIFKKPKAPDPVEVARKQEQVRQEIIAEQEAAQEEAQEQAMAKFADSSERARQLKRKGKRRMIATPYGYLGDTSDFGGSGSLLT